MSNISYQKTVVKVDKIDQLQKQFKYNVGSESLLKKNIVDKLLAITSRLAKRLKLKRIKMTTQIKYSSQKFTLFI